MLTGRSPKACYGVRRCEWEPVPRPSKQNFRENLRNLIDGAGLDDKAFAKEIGVSPATLSRWLSGTNEPSFEDLDAIANYFEKSAHELFFDPTDKRTSKVDLDTALRIVTAHAHAGKHALKE